VFRRLTAGAVSVVVTLVSCPGKAGDAAIQMLDQSFFPLFVEIPVGGEVTWEWISGEHRVKSGASSNPEDHPGELFDAPVDNAHPTFTYRFSEPGNYPFFDGLHEQTGGTGMVTVLSDAMTFLVGVVDNTFIPENLYIFAGDTVHWEHEPDEALHTVTSGRSSRPEDNPGALFDEESSDDKPSFFYTFERAGFYPYFCRHHEHMGMVGTVLIQQRFIRGDSTGEEKVDISDAIQILKTLFLGAPYSGCRDAFDANDSGRVDVTDAIFLLTFLFLGGVEIPAPFPSPGPDRTDDDLLCYPE